MQNHAGECRITTMGRVPGVLSCGFYPFDSGQVHLAWFLICAIRGMFMTAKQERSV